MKRILATTLAIMLMATSSVSALAVDLTDSPATNNGAGDYAIGVNGTYAAGTPAQDVISVDIAWGSMNFTYTDGSAGTWNPETHAYEGATQGTWSTDKAGITVTNHSNVGIDADFSFAAADGVTTTGTFYSQNADNGSYTALSADAQQFSLATAVGTDRASAPSGKLYFGVSGDPISETKSLGTITVKIAKDTKIYTGAALQAALATLGTTGGTITLGTDITLPVYGESGYNGSMFPVGAGKTLVLDLNGYTVTGILVADGNSGSQVVIKNGTIQYQIDTAQSANGGVICMIGTHTQLDDVTVNGTNIPAVANYGEMNITDSTFNGYGLIDDIPVTVYNAGTMTFGGTISIDANGGGANAGASTVVCGVGTYSFDPTACVDAGSYTVTANADGTWTVSVKTA